MFCRPNQPASKQNTDEQARNTVTKPIEMISKTGEQLLPRTGKSGGQHFASQPPRSWPVYGMGSLGRVSGLLCHVCSAAGQQVVVKTVVDTYMTIKWFGQQAAFSSSATGWQLPVKHRGLTSLVPGLKCVLLGVCSLKHVYSLALGLPSDPCGSSQGKRWQKREAASMSPHQGAIWPCSLAQTRPGLPHSFILLGVAGTASSLTKASTSSFCSSVCEKKTVFNRLQ